MSLSLATVEGSVPLDYRLYLPKEWAEDKQRCELAGVPKKVAFATKGELAWTQIDAALAGGIPWEKLGWTLRRMDAARRGLP